MNLHEFCLEFAKVIKGESKGWMDQGRGLMGQLVSDHYWLMPILERLSFDPEFPQQKDSIWPNEIRLFRGEEFTVLAYLWEPGQKDVIHDHSSWGMAGIIGRPITETKYKRLDDATISEYAELKEQKVLTLERGQTTLFLPLNKGIHHFENRGASVALTVNVYGKSLRQGGYVQFFDLRNRRVRKVYRPSRFRRILAAQAIRDMLNSQKMRGDIEQCSDQ